MPIGIKAFHKERVANQVTQNISAVPTWRAFKEEILAINVVTGALKRICHHRTRELNTAGYYAYPRVSCSADGSIVLFASNMNISSPTGYADLYGVSNPLG